MKPYRKLFIFAICIMAACSAGVENTPNSAPVQPPPDPTAVTADPAASSPASTQVPFPAGEAIYFGLRERLGEGYSDLGVFRYDVKTNKLLQVAQKGWNLQDVSPDGSKLLINHSSQLYTANPDGSETHRVSDQFYDLGARGAAWNRKGEGVDFIFSGDSGNFLVSANPDGSGLDSLGKPADSPIEIEAVDPQGVVYWQKGSCSGEGVCQREGVYRFKPGGGESERLDGMKHVQLSTDGSRIAYAYENEAGKSSLGITGTNLAERAGITLPGDLLGDFTWSPDGTRIAAVRYDRSDYSGKVSGTRNFMVDTTSKATREYAESKGILGRVLFSPEGQTLLLWSTVQNGDRNQILIYFLDLASGSLSQLQDSDNLNSSNFILLTNSYWVNN